MSTLLQVPKNGQLQNRTNFNHRKWSHWIDDVLQTEHFPAPFSSHLNASGRAKVNVQDTKDAFILEIVAPGFKKSDFKIDIETKTLSISIQKHEEEVVTEHKYTRKEFECKAFKNVFTLPNTVDDSQIKARYEAGILELTLPKREEAKEKPPRTLEVS